MTLLAFVAEHPFGVALGLAVGIAFAAIGWAWTAGSER